MTAYVLVLFSAGPQHGSAPPTAAHKAFVAERVQANEILLGGPFATGPHTGGYVLACGDLAAAEALVARDPYVVSGAFTATCSEWSVVGVNPAAIEPTKVWAPKTS